VSTLRELVTSIVEAVIGPRIDYSRTYIARVVHQAADDTLEVEPDTKKIPGLTKVPIFFGLPGVSAKVRKGARVVLGFLGGDPTLPYATVWESASVLEVVIDAEVVKLAAGSRNVAREGDPVAVFITPVQAAAIVSSGTCTVSGYILQGGPRVKAP